MEAYEELLLAELSFIAVAALYLLGAVDLNVVLASSSIVAAVVLARLEAAKLLAPLAVVLAISHFLLGCAYCSMASLALLAPVLAPYAARRSSWVLRLHAMAGFQNLSLADASATAYVLLSSLPGGLLAAPIPAGYLLLKALSGSGLLTGNKRKADALEQAFFVLLASSLSSFTSLSLVKALRMIGEEAKKLFEGIFWSVYLFWRRDTLYRSAEPLDALRYAARKSGSRILHEVAEGYAVTVLSGGDERGYLHEKTESLIGELESSWSWQARTILAFSEVAFIVSVLAPLLSVMSSLVSLSGDAVLYTSLAFSIMLDVIVVLAADTVGLPSAPAVPLGPHALLAGPLFLVALMASMALGLPAYVSVPLATLALLSPLAYRSLSVQLKAERQNKSLLNALREVVEASRSSMPGLHVLKSLEPRSREVAAASKCVESGCPVYEAVEASGLIDKKAKLAFYTLLKILELGGSLEMLDKLASFYHRLVSITKRYSRELLLTVPLAVIAPAVGFSGISLVSSLASSAAGVPGMWFGAPLSPSKVLEAKNVLSLLLTAYALTLPKVVSGSLRAVYAAVPPLVAVILSGLLL